MVDKMEATNSYINNNTMNDEQQKENISFCFLLVAYPILCPILIQTNRNYFSARSQTNNSNLSDPIQHLFFPKEHEHWRRTPFKDDVMHVY